MIKEALLVGWDVIGWLSYVTGILSAPLVLIKPPCSLRSLLGLNKHVKLSSVILFRLVKIAVPGLGHEVTGQKYFYHFFHPLFVHQPL